MQQLISKTKRWCRRFWNKIINLFTSQKTFRHANTVSSKRCTVQRKYDHTDASKECTGQRKYDKKLLKQPYHTHSTNNHQENPFSHNSGHMYKNFVKKQKSAVQTGKEDRPDTLHTTSLVSGCGVVYFVTGQKWIIGEHSSKRRKNAIEIATDYPSADTQWKGKIL